MAALSVECGLYAYPELESPGPLFMLVPCHSTYIVRVPHSKGADFYKLSFPACPETTALSR